MSSKGISSRVIVQIAAIALVGSLAAVQTGSALTATATYYFTGTCSDCTGSGHGTLVLQNYALGSSLTNANLVSWSYTSNLLTYSVTPANNPTFSIQGALPTTLPGPSLNTVIISTQASAGSGFVGFIAQTGGSWCAGSNCEDDNGTSGTWTAAPTTTPSVPALEAPGLIGLALLLACAGFTLLKRVATRHAA